MTQKKKSKNIGQSMASGKMAMDSRQPRYSLSATGKAEGTVPVLKKLRVHLKERRSAQK